jgi:hypothetical protein
MFYVARSSPSVAAISIMPEPEKPQIATGEDIESVSMEPEPPAKPKRPAGSPVA